MLKKTADFQRISEHGKKVGTKSLVILALPNKTAEVRVGLTVSKKVSQLAVDRNKIKRRLRALVREIIPQTQPMDYVIIARAAALTTEYKDLRKDLSFAISRFSV